LEEITNDVEYWGIYGSLEKGEQTVTSTLLNISATSVTTDTVIFPIIHRSSDWPELTTTKPYFIVYSTDHDQINGGIWWGEMDTPEGLNFIERGKIDVASGYQPESPFLYRADTALTGFTGEILLACHTYNEPGHTIAQETRLFSTTGGAELHLCTYTDQGRPITPQGDDSHTGYLVVLNPGEATLVGHHNVKGGTPGTSGVSTSTNGGASWTRQVAAWDLTQGMPAGYTLKDRPRIFPFIVDGVQYGIVNYFNINDANDNYLGVFTLDSLYMPIALVKTITGEAGAYDGKMYREGDIGYIPCYKAGYIQLFKYFLGEV
jgi:hypothetical protein